MVFFHNRIPSVLAQTIDVARITELVRSTRDRLIEGARFDVEDYIDATFDPELDAEDEKYLHYQEMLEGKRRICSPPFCEGASEEVTETLSSNGFRAKRACGYVNTDKGRFRHCWTEVDGLIVDVTADQFDPAYPEILIGSYSQYPEYEVIDYGFGTVGPFSR